MKKLTGTVESTEVETVDADKTVIFKGETHQPVPDLVDSTIGLSRMGVLQGNLQYPGYDDATGSVAVVTQERNGEQVPTEVEFKSADGNEAHYRFMLADVINQQLKSIKFKGAEFDVNVVPTDKNLKDLTYFNSVLGTYEANFSPKTNGTDLFFHIGDAGSDRTKIHIRNTIEGEIKGDLISGEVKCVLAGGESKIQNVEVNRDAATVKMLESFIKDDGLGCTFQQALEAAEIIDVCEMSMRDLK